MIALAACALDPAAGLQIVPEEPLTTDDLVAVPSPPPGEVWDWRWIREVPGVTPESLGDLAGDRVPAERTAEGETWTVEVVRHVGGRASEPRRASVTVGNSAPTVSVRLSPDPPFPGQDLEAVVQATDPDEEPLVVTVAWEVEGAPVAVEDELLLPGDLVLGGRTYAVTATASDGDAQASAVAIASAQDLPPTVTSATIDPLPVHEATVAGVAWTALDPDGDPVSVRITWEVGGLPVHEGTTLDGSFFDRGDVIEALVVPDDGVVTGVAARTPPVTVADSPPSATSARVFPDVLAAGTVAGCALDGWSDPDGDLEGATVRWYVDGAMVSTEPVLTGAWFVKGQRVACEATPFDGELGGPPLVSSAVDVVNSAPVAGIATITPAVPTAVAPAGVDVDVIDPDGDDVTLVVDWTVDGVVVATGPTLGGLVRGQVVEAEVRPTDGEDEGTSVHTLPVTVGNAPPTIARVATIPAAPTSSDDVAADVVAADADGDLVTIALAWLVDGVEVATVDPLPAGTAFAGEALVLRATPSDALDVGPSAETPPVVVGNGPPSLAGAVVAPDPLHPTDVATCDPVGAADPDGDAVTVDVLWWIDGVDAGTDATLSGFVAGEVVRCELVPTDGASTGDPVRSAPVVVAP